jgi:hypothetical protein
LVNSLSRTLAGLFIAAAVTLYFSTPSKAFFFHHYHHYHHHHHYNHVKTVKLSPASQGGHFKTPFWAQYAAGAGLCSTAALGIQLAMAGGKPLTMTQAHGAVAGCFLPILGQWLVAAHYQRLCALGRSNPALRMYCA